MPLCEYAQICKHTPKKGCHNLSSRSQAHFPFLQCSVSNGSPARHTACHQHHLFLFWSICSTRLHKTCTQLSASNTKESQRNLWLCSLHCFSNLQCQKDLKCDLSFLSGADGLSLCISWWVLSNNGFFIYSQQWQQAAPTLAPVSLVRLVESNCRKETSFSAATRSRYPFILSYPTFDGKLETLTLW